MNGSTEVFKSLFNVLVKGSDVLAKFIDVFFGHEIEFTHDLVLDQDCIVYS